MTPNLSPANSKFPATTAGLVACGLVTLACAICWTSLTWKKLQDRVVRAEAKVAHTQKELTERRQIDTQRRQRDKDMEAVEASLRQEMQQLDRLVKQQENVGSGTGIARDTVAAAFSNLELVNQDESASQSSEHFAIESPAGSIQLRGMPDDLEQIQFCGTLKGDQSEASTAMLSTLLGTAIPQWDATQRKLWLEKLMSVDDEIFVHQDFDRVRLNWHWTNLDGVRLDVLSIDPR